MKKKSWEEKKFSKKLRGLFFKKNSQKSSTKKHRFFGKTSTLQSST